MDETHGTNGYDFVLISVLVIDEFDEGFPVAWCLLNRQDQFLLINFFNRLKEKVGDQPGFCLMTQNSFTLRNSFTLPSWGLVLKSYYMSGTLIGLGEQTSNLLPEIRKLKLECTTEGEIAGSVPLREKLQEKWSILCA